MQELLLSLLRCPVTRTPLELQVISTAKKNYNKSEENIVWEGVLWAENDWFYPITKGIPRLLVEAFLDFGKFLQHHVPDYQVRKDQLLKKYEKLIKYALKKNRHTKQSFTQEWSIYNYEKDKTWDADSSQMLQRFLVETDETTESLKNKFIFDAGCGNGALNSLIASEGATIIGMDFSLSIERAFERNSEKKALFFQGDVQFPPVMFDFFDIVHSSGVLICTNNTELSFSCIEPCVKTGGKLSAWLYHPNKDFIHNTFNALRKVTSRLPVKVQYYIYLFTLFPVSYIIKRLKGNRENPREMMVGILDWLSHEYRWEHEPSEAASWYYKRKYKDVKITTSDIFGFNITGTRNS